MKLNKTGKGYYVSPDGRKFHKFDLPLGSHPDPDGHSFVEVSSDKEFNDIVLDKTDADIAIEKQNSHNVELIKSAKSKLIALGLSDDEIKAMIGR